MDQDIAEMQKRLETAPSPGAPQSPLSLRDLTLPSNRELAEVQHTPVRAFTPGQPLEIAVAVPRGAPQTFAVRMYYRHVNQAERHQSVEMQAKANRFSAIIPAGYTNTKYPLQYYFEVRSGADNAWLFPGLGNNLQTQPYFVVRSAPMQEG
jgi:hypothetical protein